MSNERLLAERLFVEVLSYQLNDLSQMCPQRLAVAHGVPRTLGSPVHEVVELH